MQHNQATRICVVRDRIKQATLADSWLTGQQNKPRLPVNLAIDVCERVLSSGETRGVNSHDTPLARKDHEAESGDILLSGRPC